jgi:hypothetical protein
LDILLDGEIAGSGLVTQMETLEGTGVLGERETGLEGVKKELDLMDCGFKNHCLK